MTTVTRSRARRSHAGADTSNPLRPKALSYYRDIRILMGKIQWGTDPERPAVVRARISAAPNAPGVSESGVVELKDGVWTCTRHPNENACPCRLAVQMVTGWEHLGGRAA
ncbi:hypothetical protein ACG83_11045 [Frankia sp. R43]|uniref:hypothetical protein n=1 Tax=Frankia sp. R43 TaxID=269536 RepID=UPI0006CA17E0|nr:hypothetical protein [Frankia sp. R43]KPM55800.1 hypothetical protein ACG83_11045 [Frankia sp. R43]